MLRAILFDFNGVLVDDEPIHLELLRRIVAEEGLDPEKLGDGSRYVGLEDRAAFAAAYERLGRPIDDERILRLVARKAAYYQLRVRREGFPVFPGAEELVRAAHGAGLMLGVVSGALRAEVEGALEQIGIRGCFKVVASAEDVERSKPEPDAYRWALAQLNALPPLPSRLFHPHEVLAIEDTPAGLRAAAAAGLLTLGVAQTHPAEALREADEVAASVAELRLAELQRRFGQAL